MSDAVQVHGLNQLVRSLKAAGDGLAELKEANKAAGAIVAHAAASRAPHRSGKLAAAIKPAKQQNRVRIMVPARIPYAGPIHYGWPKRGIPARPFILDAARATENQWLAFYTDAVQAVMDSVTGA